MKKITLLLFAFYSLCSAQEIVLPGYFPGINRLSPPTNGEVLIFPLHTPGVPNTYRFAATLSGANEVPPHTSDGQGAGSFDLTGRTLNLVISAFMENFPRRAFIQGPAGPAMNAPVIFDLGEPGIEGGGVPGGGGGFVWFGTITLTRAQVAQLIAGEWYVNVTSGAHPAGEIRGQILPVQPIGDSDHDGVPDGDDDCPGTTAGAVVDDSGCSIEQLCPCSGSWKSHAEYVHCVRRGSAEFVDDGIISEAERRQILKQAAKSNCGRRR